MLTIKLLFAQSWMYVKSTTQRWKNNNNCHVDEKVKVIIIMLTKSLDSIHSPISEIGNEAIRLEFFLCYCETSVRHNIKLNLRKLFYHLSLSLPFFFIFCRCFWAPLDISQLTNIIYSKKKKRSNVMKLRRCHNECNTSNWFEQKIYAGIMKHIRKFYAF